jgi:putative membrane protein
MQRRMLLLAGAATLAAAHPALAQSRGPAPGAADQPGPAETKHQQDTMRVGSLSLATSRLAVQKAQNASLKQFANFEVAEQETIAEVLKSMQGAAVTTGQGKATNAEAQDQMDAKGKEMLQKLQKASGVEFDAEYLKGQKEGHQELLKIQESYISSGRVREEVNVSKLARGQIKEHLTLLDTISGQMKKG